MMIYRKPRRRTLSADEKAANAAARESRANAAMTCQVCARKVLANTGLIAHHGYRRPGAGWQTGSCPGARHLPYEAARTTLEMHIANMDAMLSHTIKFREKIAREEIGFVRSYTDFMGQRDARGKRPVVELTVRRETLEQTKRENPRWHERRNFDDLLKAELAARDSEIESLRRYVEGQRTRFKAWRMTHKFDGAAWVAV